MRSRLGDKIIVIRAGYVFGVQKRLSDAGMHAQAAKAGAGTCEVSERNATRAFLCMRRVGSSSSLAKAGQVS